MGIEVVVTRDLFAAPSRDAGFGLRQTSAWALARQPESTLSHGIDPVSMTVFNRNQWPRLVQELRFLAQSSDDGTRQDLEEAASFIEGRTEALGSGPDRYVVFIGD